MSRINASSYDSLQKGMSYEQVAKTLGSRGTLVSSNTAQMEPGIRVATMTTEVYRWKNREGASIMAMFGHGKLRDKSQQGLD
jgi:hypothetical protein